MMLNQSVLSRSPMLIRPAMIARAVPARGRIVMPDVRCDIAWMDGRLLFSGPLTHARVSLAICEPLMVASFDPLVIRRWLNVPLHFVTNRVLPLADLAPHLERLLVEQFLSGDIEAIGLPTMAIRIAESDVRLEAAVSALRGGGSVWAAAKRAGVSERQLERLFETHLGMRPKLFSRILRLRRGITLAGRGATLTDAAASAGYADQPHFNREVRSLMGRSPSETLQHVGNVQDMLHGTVAN
jgi:AraC-like DNA-binding protein